ncbi:hypothetical protein FACS1894147_03500 [Spirochaetia bacterium]|nr:hypothetical protein FACS1894147_03500 [Spirochaetia bacterium]
MSDIREVKEVFHKLEAFLYPNYLGKGDGEFVARAKAEAPLYIKDYCASAKIRGGFIGKVDDLEEYANLILNEAVYQLLDGFSVHFGDFFSLHCRIGGTYHGERDKIDPENIQITFRAHKHLKDLLTHVVVQNEGLAGTGAFIDEIVDVYTNTLNSALTPGQMLHIMGHKIKTEGEGEAVGVWFINQDAGKQRTKVSGNLGINKGTEVMVMIPPLVPGTYKLEIVTGFSGSTALKEPRTIAAEPLLQVAAPAE